MTSAALIVTALLFGGMCAFSFGFAALMFHIFDETQGRRALRMAFPQYYTAVIVVAVLATIPAALVDRPASFGLLAVALSTVYARQSLMPMINAATDSGDKGRFGRLHGASVALQLVQIGVTGWALIRLG